MDRFLLAVKSEVISEGADRGVDLDTFWRFVSEEYERLLRCTLKDSAKPFIWRQICESGHFIFKVDGRPTIIMEQNQNLQIHVEEKSILRFYSTGLPLPRLSTVQMTILQKVAKSRYNGIIQSVLAKDLEMDPRSLFHQLKVLIHEGILTKEPITYCKTFTYVLYLWRYCPEEMQEREGEGVDGDDEAKPLLRAKITEALQAIPSKSMSMFEIVKLLGSNSERQTRAVRRQLRFLVARGFIEYLVSPDIVFTQRAVKLKKLYDHVEYRMMLEPKVKKNTFLEEGHSESLLHPIQRTSPHLPLIIQVYNFIDRSGPNGVTSGNIMNYFGLGVKYSYRLTEILLKEKAIIKVAEFDGKERRHRMYTPAGKEAKNTNNDSVIEITDSGVIPINRLKRLRELERMVNEDNILESGKNLARQLQRNLNETDYEMDLKTLKRLVGVLEEEGKIKTFTIIFENGLSKMLLVKGTISLEDPTVHDFVKKLKASRSEVKVIPDEVNQPPEKVSPESYLPVQRRTFGFIFGELQRCRLLHEFIMTEAVFGPPTSSEDIWSFEAFDLLFNRITLSLFLRIIGLKGMSDEMADYITDINNCKMQLGQLPEWIKEEINRKCLRRQKGMIKILLEDLVNLGLLSPDARYPIVSHNIAFKYQISHTGLILNLADATPKNMISFDNLENVGVYWDTLASTSTEKIHNQSQISPSIPEIYVMALNPAHWQNINPLNRTFRKQLKRMVLSYLDAHLCPTEEEITRLAEDHEITVELVREEFERVKEGVERARYEKILERSTRDRSKIKPLRPRLTMDANFDDVKGKTVLQSFTLEDTETIKLGYFILQRKEFKSVGGTTNWSLLSQISQCSVENEELRHFFFRLQTSYHQTQLLNNIEMSIKEIDWLVENGVIEGPLNLDDKEKTLEERFACLFSHYRSSLEKLPEIRRQIAEGKFNLSKPIDFHLHSSGRSRVPWDEGLEFSMASSLRRATRPQVIKYTRNLPLIRWNSSCGQLKRYSEIGCMLRKILAVSPSEMQSDKFEELLLEAFSREAVEEAVSELVDKEVLSRKETNIFRSRIPGSEYFVNHQLIQLLDGSDWQGPLCSSIVESENSFDFSNIIQQVNAKRVKLDFSITEGELVRYTIPQDQNQSITPSVSLKNSIESRLNSHKEEVIWWDCFAKLHLEILNACLRRVYELVYFRPGISQSTLTEVLYPFLEAFEISTCLNILLDANLVEEEDLHYFIPTNSPLLNQI